MENRENDSQQTFRSYGTVAFMILLLTLTAIAWFSVYYIQIDRH
ncbi:MAG TPA: hypothetical protein VG101_05605 [Puia sp.]|nr:hypothetical protein [Puia sp.]